ncbi:MAG: PspC domain-containing protein [candidate division WOR-3 bacterium]
MMKKLYRSRDYRLIAGICGGLGEYFDIDPIIFRMIFIALLINGGAGILIYILMWIFVPIKH